MKKTIWTIGLFIFLLIIAASWFYRAIQSDYYAKNDLAASNALAQSSMSRADHIEYVGGEREYRIVFGVNDNNEKLIVWIGDDLVHEEKASDGVDRSAVRESIRERHGEVDLLRLVPSVYNGNYVWEVFFRRAENAETRHYFEYYRFSDGERLDTLRLNAD